MTEVQEHQFTVEQFHALGDEERKAVLAVIDYLTSSRIDISDENLSEALNLVKPVDGCVPSEEEDEDLLLTIRRKFAAIYQPALEVAEMELKQQGFEHRKDFNFSLIIEPSYDGSTQVAIVDYDKPVCYLYEWSKAWHFHFVDLSELAQAVITEKNRLVKMVKDAPKSSSPTAA